MKILFLFVICLFTTVGYLYFHSGRAKGANQIDLRNQKQIHYATKCGTNFDIAILYLLENEGGLNHHKFDKGGVTNLGISLAFLQSEGIDVNKDGKVDNKDIRNLTLEEAKEIYKTYFWDRMGLDGIQDQRLAIKLFDSGVNMGTYTAVKLLQKAIRCVKTISIDGIVGSQTSTILNKLTNQEKDIVYKAFVALWKAKYISLCIANVEYRVFIRGWLLRAERRVEG